MDKLTILVLILGVSVVWASPNRQKRNTGVSEQQVDAYLDRHTGLKHEIQKLAGETMNDIQKDPELTENVEHLAILNEEEEMDAADDPDAAKAVVEAEKAGKLHTDLSRRLFRLSRRAI